MGYRTPIPDHPVHYGLPSPWLTVIFSLDDGVESASTLDRLPGSGPDAIIAAGLHTRASFVRQRPEQTGVQLAVHPLACRTLFGLPAAELSVDEYDGGDVLGRAAVTTQQRLSETRDWSTAFGLLDDHLRGSLDRRGVEVRSEVRHAWHLLQRTGGRVSIARVAETVGLTARHLGTLFQREVGRSPKQVAQLFRFQAAVAEVRTSISRTGRSDLGTIAATAGYADQAHLTRDFVERLGVPPTHWIREEFRNLQDPRRWAGPDSDHE